MRIGPRTDESFDWDALTGTRVFERRRACCYRWETAATSCGLDRPAVKAAASGRAMGYDPDSNPGEELMHHARMPPRVCRYCRRVETAALGRMGEQLAMVGLPT